MQRIERHVTLADEVITTLSSFARMPVPQMQPVLLGPFLREVLEANPVPESCQVVVDCPPAVPPALADPAQLRIVFGNLIRNAREAMPRGGQLFLTAQRAGEHV